MLPEPPTPAIARFKKLSDVDPAITHATGI